MTLSALPGLGEWCAENGYLIEDVDPEEASITDHADGSVWRLFRVDSWVQVKGVLDDVKASHAVCATLARINGRLLGCRYGIDENTVLILADIFPHDQTGISIGAALTQMQWVADCTYDLLKSVQGSDNTANETDIDAAFGIFDEAAGN